MMSKFKAVLFDLGNTLLYFNASWPKTFSRADLETYTYLKSVGLEIDKHMFLKEFRYRINEYHKLREIEYVEVTTAYLLRDLLKDLGIPKVSSKHIRKALEKMYQVSQAHWIPEEDCIPMLESLKATGYQLGIISNAGDDADVQKLVDNSQIRNYMDFVLSSAACGLRKPDPRIFDIALAYWGYKNDDVIMVGDTLNADILGARKSDIHSVWIKRRAAIQKQLDPNHLMVPDNTINTLSELPDLISDLSKKV